MDLAALHKSELFRELTTEAALNQDSAATAPIGAGSPRDARTASTNSSLRNGFDITRAPRKPSSAPRSAKPVMKMSGSEA